MSPRTYLVNPETGNRFLVGGCLKKDTRHDPPKFSSFRTVSASQLPPSVDLRQLMSPVENQGDIGSCCANAFAGAYEFLMVKNTRKYLDVSRLFLYYNARIADGMPSYNMQDAGTSISGAMQSVIADGCCEETLYPYQRIYLNRQPPDHCYVNAKSYLTKQAMKVEIDLSEMKACLAQGFPIIFGIYLYQSFAEAETNGGRVPTPNYNDSGYQGRHGSHAMLIVGYSDRSQCFIVRNSWGSNWGDQGYCYIRYDYMCNPNFSFDMYAIQLIGNELKTVEDRNIANTYDWTVDKHNKWRIPHDYPYENFHFKFFWNLADKIDYFHQKIHQKHSIDLLHRINLLTNDSKLKKTIDISLILWIDKNSQNNLYLTQKLTKENNVQIDFCGKLSDAEEYLTKYREQIQSNKSFQIIYQVYSQDEYENSLKLIEYLNKNHFEHIPLTVFTQDIYDFSEQIDKRAATMKLKNWQQQLFYTNSSDELILKCKDNRNHSFLSYTN